MTALALLHGFTGRPSDFERVRAAFEPRMAVVAPPLLGHGTNDDTVTTFEAEVDRVATELRRSGSRLCVVGYSLGGRIALGLLVRHAGLFSSAVLVGAQPGLPSAAERAARRADDLKLRRLLEDEGIEAFVDRWEKLPLLATDGRVPDVLRTKQRRERLAHDPKCLARSLAVTGLGEMPAYSSALADLRFPTTLIAGALDTKFTRIAHEMAMHAPAASVEIVEGAGHNVLLEKPDAVVTVIERVLALAGQESP